MELNKVEMSSGDLFVEMNVNVNERDVVNGTESEGIGIKGSLILLPDVSKMKPSLFEIEFKKERVLLFSESSESFEPSLYFVPLTNLLLKLKEHFNVLTDVKLEFPHIGLEFDSNSVYSEKLSLVHVLALHKRVGIEVPFFAVLSAGASSFRERYEQLVNLSTPEEGAISDPLAPAALESKNDMETEDAIVPVPDVDVGKNETKGKLDEQEETQKMEDSRPLNTENDTKPEIAKAEDLIETEIETEKNDVMELNPEAKVNVTEAPESTETPRSFETKGNEFEPLNPDIQIEEIEQEDHQTNIPEVFPEEEEIMDEFAPETAEEPLPQPIIEPLPHSEPNPETEPQLEPQPELQPELQPEPQPEPQLERQPEPQPELQLELQPEPQPEKQTEVEPEIEPELVVEPEQEQQHQPQSEYLSEPTEAQYDSETSQFSDIYILYSDQEDLPEHTEEIEPAIELEKDHDHDHDNDQDHVTDSTESDTVFETRNLRNANRKRSRDFLPSTDEDTGNFNSYDAHPPNKKPKLSFERFSTNDPELNQEELLRADPQGNEPVGNDGEEVVVSPEAEEELDIDIGQFNDDWPAQENFHLNLPINQTSL